MKMLRVTSVSILAASVFLALASAHTNQAPAPPDGLPDAPGKAVLVRMCTACHGTDVIVETPRTVPVWAETILLMKSFGAEGSEEDWKTVGDYLITHLAHLDVNKATAGEIALVFWVNEKIAEGVVAYRDKQGGFKTIDDLKKAPDLEAAKIDALRPRLIFPAN
jgi:competence protein ComEA